MVADNPEDELFELIAECVRRVEDEGAPALEQVCAAHPQHASVIRRRVEWLIGMGLAPTPEPRAAALPERLGDYRLLRYLGGGGMGVVYLARQESLGRDVALKLIRPEHLYFPGARERFRREVEVVARLQHPGIVPIYTVGEEGGIPFFAMEHIAGCSLAEVLEALAARDPSSVTGTDLARIVGAQSAAARHDQGAVALRFGASLAEAAVRIGQQVADALEHAHQRGVVHRDIKPSNIMLTRDGRALLLDFGLASHGDLHRLTRSSARIGSVPYMSPEQVLGRGEDVDARTDVYSLGVTLYELLTLRPPYLASDEEHTRRLILAAQPGSIRARNATVAWDLETVCLAAMERDRERRYQSAAALLADIDNLLALRPIAARRPGAPLRVRRWMQRHPARTVAITLLWFLVLGWALLEHDARQRVLKQRTVADREHQRATAHFHKVLDAINQLLQRVEAIDNESTELEELRTNLLRDALAIYGSFEGSEAVDPALLQDLARAHYRLGGIRQALGNFTDAERSFREAERVLEELRRERPHDLVLLEEQVRCWRGLTTILVVDRLPEARRTCEQALARIEPELPLAAEDVGLAWLRAKVFSDLGMVHARSGARADAQHAFASGAAILEALRQRVPDDQDVQFQLAVVRNHISNFELEAGHHDAARALALQAREAARPLLDRSPRSREVAHLYAISTLNLASALARQGPLADAERYHLEAIAELRELCRRFQNVAVFRRELASALHDLGSLWQDEQRRLPEAIDLLRSAIAIERAELESGQGAADVRRQLAASCLSLAEALRLRGERTEASQLLEQGIDQAEQAQAGSSQDARIPPLLLALHWSLTATQVEQGDHAAAALAIEALVPMLDELGPTERAPALRRAAMYCMRCRRLAAADPSLGADERSSKVSTYARLAIGLLRDAVEQGLARAVLAADSEFAELHGDSTFGAVIGGS